MDALLRLQNEYKNLQKNLTFGCYARPEEKGKNNTKNWFLWNGQIFYEGIFYKIQLNFTKKYPEAPPEVKFVSPVFNPNVYSKGQVCLDLISNRWTPSTTISEVLKGLVQLLKYPNPDSPANCTAANLFRKDKNAYNKKAKEVASKNMKYNVLGIYTEK
ncbi:UbcD6 [Ecytonucleospora hepatopenaei]|uniref:UbcD6 n=1 Tax=Ecytonucleospora hepatopenaei TaxID=646526 RepID=A0A1W0E6E7_9MICR|nr:UbcD6 [Ecytonucleospora hepatopenaei]